MKKALVCAFAVALSTGIALAATPKPHHMMAHPTPTPKAHHMMAHPTPTPKAHHMMTHATPKPHATHKP